jgi:hypothetical protein
MKKLLIISAAIATLLSTSAIASEKDTTRSRVESAEAYSLEFPTIAKDQTRDSIVANTIKPPLNDGFDTSGGPGPGNAGASACSKNTSCRTREGYTCKEFTGSTCYTWVQGDGQQRCAAC